MPLFDFFLEKRALLENQILVQAMELHDQRQKYYRLLEQLDYLLHANPPSSPLATFPAHDITLPIRRSTLLIQLLLQQC